MSVLAVLHRAEWGGEAPAERRWTLYRWPNRRDVLVSFRGDYEAVSRQARAYCAIHHYAISGVAAESVR